MVKKLHKFIHHRLGAKIGATRGCATWVNASCFKMIACAVISSFGSGLLGAIVGPLAAWIVHYIALLLGFGVGSP